MNACEYACAAGDLNACDVACNNGMLDADGYPHPAECNVICANGDPSPTPGANDHEYACLTACEPGMGVSYMEACINLCTGYGSAAGSDPGYCDKACINLCTGYGSAAG